MKPANVVIPYLRQSQGRDDETEESSLSLEAQEREIHAWAVRAGYSNVEESVRDWDLSGVDPYRPGLLELRDRVRPGCIVAVWRWDRLGRKLTLSESMVDALEALGATVVSVTQGSDRFARQVYGMVAESEYRAHSARMSAMKQAVARRGGYKGGPQPPFGYRQAHSIQTVDQDGNVKTRSHGQLIADESESLIVLEIFTRISKGEGLFPIARDLLARGVPTKAGGTWGTTHVRRIATNRTYLGEVHFRGELAAENAHPTLVDRDLFDRVQAILTNPQRPRSIRTPRDRTPSWTAGYVMHACGAPMYSIPIMRKSGGKTHYSQHFACSTSYKERTCGIDGRHIAETKVEAAARSCLSADLSSVTDIESAIQRARVLAGANEVADERARLNLQLKEAERIYDRARAWYVQSTAELSWMQEQLEQFESVRKDVAAKLAVLPIEPDRQSYEQGWEVLQSQSKSIAFASDEQLRELLILVGAIVVTPCGPNATSISLRYQAPFRDLIVEPHTITMAKRLRLIA